MSSRVLEAIVIRTRPLGEADVLATLYSRGEGKVRGVARGARRQRSRLSAGVQAFTHGTYELWKGRTLDGIRQCQITASFPALRSDLDRMLCAGYMCRAADLLTTDADPSEPFFLLLLTSLSVLETLHPELVRRFFEIRALGVFGFRPELGSCAACGRPVPPGGKVVFSPAVGGVACTDCRGPAAGGVILSPAARDLLLLLQRVHPRRLVDVAWPQEGSDEGGRALTLLLEHVVDRPLGADLLDSVGDGGPEPVT